MSFDTQKFTVKNFGNINLSDFQTIAGTEIDKKTSKDLLKQNVKEISALQELLYAHDRYSLLVVFQAPDAAGKDGAIEHVFSGVNPQGVKVTSFKSPSKQELAHDYLWRHYKVLPEKGMIEVFNRSHYENVIVTRVHPQYLVGNAPEINKPDDADEKFWQMRYRQINDFEKHIYENGTHILKFYLHLSIEEQKKRFLSRIDTPEKNWKFNSDDLKERALWDKYRNAYEKTISETSFEHAPWHIIPADNKAFARLAVSQIILEKLKSMKMNFPTGETLEQLQAAKQLLLNEK